MICSGITVNKWQSRDSNPSESDSKARARTNKSGQEAQRWGLESRQQGRPALRSSALPGLQ